MDLGLLCATLQSATSPLPQERQAAEHQLTQLQGTPGFLWGLLQIVARDDVDMGIRHMASIHFKNMLGKKWRSDGAEGVAEEEKGVVRQHLLEALARSPPQIRKQLAECLKSVVSQDYPDSWPNLLQLALEGVQSGDQQRLYGGLMALRIVMRKYEFKDREDRVPAILLVDAAFPLLLSVLKQLIALPNPPLDIADYIKLILKTFWSSCYLEIPSLLRQEAVFLEWMACFQALLERPVPQEGAPTDRELLKAYPWWKVKKWLLHICNRMFNRFGDAKRAKGEERQFADVFEGKCAGVLLGANIVLLKQLQSGHALPERITNLSLQYLTYCIGRKPMYLLLQPHLPFLLSDITFPLMCFGDEDNELWTNDPHEYIRKGYDLIEDMYSARTAAINFVAELLTKKSKEHLDPYLANIVAILGRYAAAPPEMKPYREKDGALLAVGALHEKLKGTKRYAGQLETMLVQHVLPEFSCPVGHLRAKAAWVAGQYADIEFEDNTRFTAAIHSVIGLLRDPDLPVRVDAVVALRSFIEASEDLELLRPLIPQLLDDFFRLMNEVENEDLVFTLEVLVERFGEEMAPYALGLVTNLAASFWKSMKSSEESGTESANADDDDDMGALAAAGCLRAIGTILESVAALPQLFPLMEPHLLPILLKMISTEGQDVIEEVLEIATYMTFLTPTLSPQLWAIWPLMVNALKEFGIDFFENFLGPFDNFISRGTDHFLTCPDPNYPASLFDLVSGIMQDKEQSDRDITSAPKLLSSVLQNCRGRVDQWVEPYVAVVLQRMQSADSRYLKDLLVLVVADALHYNAALTLSVLQKLNATSAVFEKWVQMLHVTRKSGKPAHFKREYDKKVCILGLTSALAVPAQSFPPELMPGQNQLLLALLKLLVAYKEQQAEATKGDDDEEEEEDEGEEEDDHEWKEADGGGEEDEEEEAEEGDEVESAHLKKLAKRAQKLLGDDDDDEDEDDAEYDDDYFTDDEEDVMSPIDSVDPFIFFSDMMNGMSSIEPQRFHALVGSLDFSGQAMAHDVSKQAEERRKAIAQQAAEGQQTQ